MTIDMQTTYFLPLPVSSTYHIAMLSCVIVQVRNRSQSPSLPPRALPLGCRCQPSCVDRGSSMAGLSGASWAMMTTHTLWFIIVGIEMGRFWSM